MDFFNDIFDYILNLDSDGKKQGIEDFFMLGLFEEMAEDDEYEAEDE